MISQKELHKRWQRETDEAWLAAWKRRQRPTKPRRARGDWPDIFDRDGTVCSIPGCQLGEVRFDLPWPHPLSPVVDHEIPLSRGGADTTDNKRLAHARCNGCKGSKLDSEL